jgi:soluble lytic murein transglycosylase-like protein
VQAIIRAVWPDELEGRAIEIAQRESNFIPTARNSCCLGVFQVYWSVHKSWLAGIGITSAEQLYDPTLNARAALALYERAGGWGPWGF